MIWISEENPCFRFGERREENDEKAWFVNSFETACPILKIDTPALKIDKPAITRIRSHCCGLFGPSSGFLAF